MEIKGLNSVISELIVLGKDIESKIDVEIEEISVQIEGDAKLFAPKNNGDLMRSISHAKVKSLVWKVTVNEKYGAYIEFGTGAKVKVPPEFKVIADSYKGKKNGTFDDFIEAMTLYFKQKGYDTKYVWIACINKINNGMNPQPFLYPAYKKGVKDLKTNLKKLLTNYNKKI